MKIIKLYNSILKTHLFKLGGFVIKKKIKFFFKGLNNNICSFFIKKIKHSYSLLNPNLSLFQLTNIFKFYIDLILVNKDILIAAHLNKTIITLPTNSLSSINFFTISNFIGGLFSNKLASSWSVIENKVNNLKNFPSLGIIFNCKLQNVISKSFYFLGIPTIGFYNYKLKKNYLTYPIFLDNNVYILYFFLRLFLRLLYFFKFKF